MSSSYSDLKEDIKNIFIASVLAIIALVVGLYLLVTYVLFSFVFAIVPPEELTRNEDGVFIVNTDNYRNWKVYSNFWKSKSDFAKMEGVFAMRFLPKITKDCSGIKNCENYESDFYNLTYTINSSSDVDNSSSVLLIRPEDDSLVSMHIEELRSSVKKHNDSVLREGFSAKIDYIKPVLKLEKSYYISIYNHLNLHREPRYNSDIEAENVLKKIEWQSDKIISKAFTKCRNNSKGCLINLGVRYDMTGFPNVELYALNTTSD